MAPEEANAQTSTVAPPERKAAARAAVQEEPPADALVEEPGRCRGDDTHTKRIGLLVVHGMGEQKPGDHLENVVRNFLASWEGSIGTCYEVRDISVRGKRRTCGAHTCGGGSCNEPAPDTPCKCPECAPAVVRVSLKDGQNLDLHCHEVWWADLGQRRGLRHAVRFWGWVCSVPFRRRKVELGSGAEEARRGKVMEEPQLESKLRWLACLGERVILLYFVIFTVLLGITWGLLRRILRRWAPSPVILLRSFGDVAVYQEEGRVDTGSGGDMTLPPRFAIRRRMVREMVAMAERGYERWYVMAHSLGSVVAFNGLMEPDYVLPNYLSEEHWKRLKGTPLRSNTRMAADRLRAIRPRRPHWLAANDGLCRQSLFEGLAGFVTYGSPLHLFASLWPVTVLVNLKSAFGAGFEWINLHSPLDPFSGALHMYRKMVKKCAGGTPTEVLSSHLYSGSWAAFIAHAKYRRPRKRGIDFCRALGRWFFSVSDFRMDYSVNAAWARFVVCLQIAGVSLLLLGVACVLVCLVVFVVLRVVPGGAEFWDPIVRLLANPLEFEWRWTVSLRSGRTA